MSGIKDVLTAALTMLSNYFYHRLVTSCAYE